MLQTNQIQSEVSAELIPLCGNDEELCERLTLATLSKAPKEMGDNEFWLQKERALLSILYAHASTFANPTPANLYKFITTSPAEVIMKELRNSSNAIAKNQATELIALQYSTLFNSIMIGVESKLRSFWGISINEPCLS